MLIPKSLSVFVLTILLTLAIGCGDAGEDRSFPSDGSSDVVIGGNSPGATTQTTQTGAATTASPNPLASAQPSSSPAGIPVSSSRISSFIWKPESERDGNLVVLVNPVSVRVEVTGDISERLVDSGPSNGKGTTARARHTGCAFGTNIIVEFFDARGLPIPTNNGNLKLRVPNGCDRYEF